MQASAATAAGLTTLRLAVTGIAASRGALHFEPPPTMLPVFLITFAIAIGLAFSPVGTRIAIGLPIAVRVEHARLALLINIIGVALLSAPTPVRVFMNEPANVWIAHAPWVWLPTVMVLAALCGHALVYRRLAIEARVPRPAQNDGGVSLARLAG